MDNIDGNFLLHVVSLIGMIAAVYGAIRQDIKHIHEKLQQHGIDIGLAHKRVTDHIEHFHTRGNNHENH